MHINTDDLQTIRAAEYDESTDMLRMVIVCRPDDVAGIVEAHEYFPSTMQQEADNVIDRIYGRVRNRAIGADEASVGQ